MTDSSGELVERRRSSQQQQNNDHTGDSLTRIIAPTNRSSASQKTTDTSSESWTINKLNLQFSHLYGREKETEILQAAVTTAAAATAPGKAHVLFVSGESGVGKSALAETLRPTVAQAGGMLGRGKFQLQHHVSSTTSLTNPQVVIEPYKAILDAMADFVEQILLKYPSERVIEVREHLQQALPDELAVLVIQAIPSLQALLSFDADKRTTQSRGAVNGAESSGSPSGSLVPSPLPKKESTSSSTTIETKNQFVYAFRRLILAFSKSFVPLVILIDDLQWADRPSLELIESFTTDIDISNLLFLGLYRSDEVGHIQTRSIQDHPVARTILKLRQKANENRIVLQELKLRNLSVLDVQAMLVDLLGTTDRQRINDLATVCHERTQGNVFFLIKFLSMLNERGLLQFNFGTMTWVWDEAALQKHAKATDNVVNLLRSKLLQLSEEQKDLLKIAACFGDSFKVSYLCMVWTDVREGSSKHMPLERPESVDNVQSRQHDEDNDVLFQHVLSAMVQEGYLHRLSDSDYRFAHDKILEAADSLNTMQERRILCARSGSILQNKLSPSELESSILLVVNLLNEGDAPEGVVQRIAMADLNRQACRKAMAVAAFAAAAQYAAIGIELLDHPNKWKNSYMLTLDLYSLGTEAEGLLGHVDEMKALYDEVMAQTNIPDEEKLRVDMAYCTCVAGQGRPKEALEYVVSLFEKFGVRFPRTKIGFLYNLVKHVLTAKKYTKNGVIANLGSLSKDSDALRDKLCPFFDKLGLFCYLSGNELFALVDFTALEWTLTFGQSRFSPSAVGGSALIMASLGDADTAAELARASLSLCHEGTPHFVQSRVLHIAYGFVFHWTQPLKVLSKQLILAYEYGLLSGGTDNACLCVLTYVQIQTVTSYPFNSLSEDIAVYSRQCKDLQMDFPYTFLMMYWQLVDSFVVEHPATDDLELYGSRLSREQGEQWKKDHVTFYQVWSTLQGYLYTVFGEHQKGAELAIEIGAHALMKAMPGSSLAYLDTMVKGLSCIAAARHSKRNGTMRKVRKYLGLAKAMQKKVDKWVSHGNPNVLHLKALFEAEFAAWRGMKAKALVQYQRAIVISARSGLLMDAGICSERMAVTLLEMGQSDDATFRWGQALLYYQDANASRKVAMLRREHPELLLDTEGTTPM